MQLSGIATAAQLRTVQIQLLSVDGIDPIKASKSCNSQLWQLYEKPCVSMPIDLPDLRTLAITCPQRVNGEETQRV